MNKNPKKITNQDIKILFVASFTVFLNGDEQWLTQFPYMAN